MEGVQAANPANFLSAHARSWGGMLAGGIGRGLAVPALLSLTAGEKGVGAAGPGEWSGGGPGFEQKWAERDL